MLIGAFDDLYSLRPPDRSSGSTRSRLTRRDLLLQVGELDRWSRAVARGGSRSRRTTGKLGTGGALRQTPAAGAGARDLSLAAATGEALTTVQRPGVRELAARQSQAARPVEATPVQLALDLDDAPHSVAPSGLPEMTGAERVRAELEVLGLDATRHVVDFYEPFLAAIGATRAPDLVRCRSQAEVLVAGVKVATQTPPIRSGKRVVFVTLDDARGPIDATFFEDAQGPYAATLFHSWLLVVRGHVRRTGPRGVSMRATGCWELTGLHEAWQHGGLDAVAALMEQLGVSDEAAGVTDAAVAGAAESRAARPVMARPPVAGAAEVYEPREVGGAGAAGGMSRPSHGTRRVLVHPSGFRQSPYADVKPPGDDPASMPGKAAARKEGAKAPRKLWHSSPGSSGG